MTEYVRRLVSGNKARFRDPNLNVELDLVYLTDRIIIMGYPADGFESFYRNDREAVKKFLQLRHGNNFWVFNFCPIRENSYPSSVFDGRVSRYPFPDHHAPPLAIMPLAAREMAEWLDGSPERVVVLHCKAGKGRSGTLACTYLLSCDDAPSLQNQKSLSAAEWTHDVIQAIEHDPDATVSLNPGAASPTAHVKSFPDLLNDVLALHTARRMKPLPPSSSSNPSSTNNGSGGEKGKGKGKEKPKQGVSIPSQRRWLGYWAVLLGGNAPAHLWAISPPSSSPPSPASQSEVRPKVRLTRITLRMREVGAMKLNLVRAATALLDRASNGGKGSAARGHVWVSLARYDDDLVGMLEKWEKHTRDPGGRMGRRRKGAEEVLDGEAFRGVFDEKGRWDGGKMVRSFARLGARGGDDVEKSVDEEGKILTYTLHPLTESGWVHIRDQLPTSSTTSSSPNLEVEADLPPSEANSMYDLTQSAQEKEKEKEKEKERGVILDAGREVRVKLYMGQIFMCWIWLIPAFHMPPPPSPSPSSSPSAPPAPTKLTLTRKECDFPVGVGSAIVDVEIEMEWVLNTGSADREGEGVPPRKGSAESGEEGMAGAVEAVVAGGSLSGAVERKQAVED